jgi:hypothetical protein
MNCYRYTIKLQTFFSFVNCYHSANNKCSRMQFKQWIKRWLSYTSLSIVWIALIDETKIQRMKRALQGMQCFFIDIIVAWLHRRVLKRCFEIWKDKPSDTGCTIMYFSVLQTLRILMSWPFDDYRNCTRFFIFSVTVNDVLLLK